MWRVGRGEKETEKPIKIVHITICSMAAGRRANDNANNCGSVTRQQCEVCRRQSGIRRQTR